MNPKRLKPARLVADPPIEVGEYTLIPLARVTCLESLGGLGGLLQISKTPEMVVVASPRGQKVVGIGGEEVPLEEVVREVEGLEETLKGIYSESPTRRT